MKNSSFFSLLRKFTQKFKLIFSPPHPSGLPPKSVNVPHPDHWQAVDPGVVRYSGDRPGNDGGGGNNGGNMQNGQRQQDSKSLGDIGERQ